MYPADPINLKFHCINFQGNIIPTSWKDHIRHKGRVDLNALFILSELVYWYRPIVVRDERGVDTFFKKYKADLLQKSYCQLEEVTGLTKKQIRDALGRLEGLGLIKRHLRTVDIKKGEKSYKLGNVLYIEIFVNKIFEITHSKIQKIIPSLPTGQEGIPPPIDPQVNRAIDPQVMTYTENTDTENSVCITGGTPPEVLENFIFISHPDGSKKQFSVEDIYTISVQQKLKWTKEEIEQLWEALKEYKHPIREIDTFLKGVHKNLNTKKIGAYLNVKKAYNKNNENKKFLKKDTKKNDLTSAQTTFSDAPRERFRQPGKEKLKWWRNP